MTSTLQECNIYTLTKTRHRQYKDKMFSQSYTKHINTHCGENAIYECLNAVLCWRR